MTITLTIEAFTECVKWYLDLCWFDPLCLNVFIHISHSVSKYFDFSAPLGAKEYFCDGLIPRYVKCASKYLLYMITIVRSNLKVSANWSYVLPFNFCSWINFIFSISFGVGFQFNFILLPHYKPPPHHLSSTKTSFNFTSCEKIHTAFEDSLKKYPNCFVFIFKSFLFMFFGRL